MGAARLAWRVGEARTVTDKACIAPGTTRPEDLLAWLDGAADRWVSDHIAACRACREEALAYRALDRWLAGVLYRADCPSVAMLADYAYGVLSPGERAVVVRHLVSCGRCMAELAELRGALSPIAEYGP